jgi:Fe-S-cluster containining protein
MEHTLSKAVEAAAGRPEVGAAVRSVYDAVGAEIDRRRPACAVSGRCCRFEEYGHRLYVTTLELAAFLRCKNDRETVQDEATPATSLSSFILQPAALAWDGTGCPFQRAKLCSVHAIRPFGCRMYFCDPTSTDWQNDAYERYHGRLKHLHEALGVPYFYVEWRQALRAMGWATPAGVSGEEGSF